MSANRELRSWMLQATQHCLCEQTADLHACVEHRILDRGREFASSPLSSTQLSVVLAAFRRARASGYLFVPKRCFANAAQLVLADRTGELAYVEGFAMGRVVPVHHAWVIIGGKVVDVTWSRTDPVTLMEHELSGKILGTFDDTRAYVGVSFCREWVREKLQEEDFVPLLESTSWMANTSGSKNGSILSDPGSP